MFGFVLEKCDDTKENTEKTLFCKDCLYPLGGGFVNLFFKVLGQYLKVLNFYHKLRLNILNLHMSGCVPLTEQNLFWQNGKLDF